MSLSDHTYLCAIFDIFLLSSSLVFVEHSEDPQQKQDDQDSGDDNSAPHHVVTPLLLVVYLLRASPVARRGDLELTAPGERVLNFAVTLHHLGE